MLAPRTLALAAIAAGFVIAVAPQAATARGGGHGGMAAHFGIATPHAMAPLASMPGGKQTGSQPPSQSRMGVTASSPPSAPALPDALPPSAIAAPTSELPTIAPLSPPVTTTFLGSGGTARPDALASPTASSTSPSEAAPSTAGGGGDTLQDCMGFWDREAHMSKQEWRAACLRIQNRFAGMQH